MEHSNEKSQQLQISSSGSVHASGISGPWLVVCLPILISLFLLSHHNYLLFHSIVEIFSIVVAVTIFSIGWHSRQFVQNNTLLVLAVAYLPVGALDFFHIFSYKEMGIFLNTSANIPVQLWVAARYLEAVALFIAATLLGDHKRINNNALLAGCLLTGTLLLMSIHPLNIFPTCFVEGEGLTAFKIGSEYFISSLLLLTATTFWQQRQFMDDKTLNLLLASIAVTILSGVSSTLYTDADSLSIFFSHTFKLISVVLVYLALVQGLLKSPHQSLFRKLALELQQRKFSEEKLRTINLELDSFVYTVSHDLRAPLTPIISYADFLREKDGKRLDCESLALLQKISDLGRGMTETLEDLLTLVKVGHLTPPERPVDSAEVVDDVLITLSGRLLETKQLVKKQQLPEVRLPESLLRQLFSNLISNALRYGTSRKAIEVGGERLANRVRFFVQDHGPGIPCDEHERIFDLFYRGSEEPDANGAGAGLAIVKKIAGLYHGKTWVEETPGGGATIWVEMEEPGVK